MQQFLRMVKGKLWQGYVSVEDEQWKWNGEKKKNTTVEEHAKLMPPCWSGRTNREGSMTLWEEKCRRGRKEKGGGALRLNPWLLCARGV